jgi:hypothetical protein
MYLKHNLLLGEFENDRIVFSNISMQRRCVKKNKHALLNMAKH